MGAGGWSTRTLAPRQGPQDSRWAKRHAEDVAHGVRGVEDVDNQIHIEIEFDPNEGFST